jgi:hypothetical protein
MSAKLKPEAEEDPFAIAICRAQAEIETAIERAGLRDDVLRLPCAALSTVLGVFPELVARMEAAAVHVHPKPPPPGQEVVDAIERSIRGVAFRIGADLNRRTRTTIMVGMVGAAMLGGVVGYVGCAFNQSAPPACVQGAR